MPARVKFSKFAHNVSATDGQAIESPAAQYKDGSSSEEDAAVVYQMNNV